MPCSLSVLVRAVRIVLYIAAVRVQVVFVWGRGVGGPHGPSLVSLSFPLTRGGAATIVQGVWCQGRARSILQVRGGSAFVFDGGIFAGAWVAPVGGSCVCVCRSGRLSLDEGDVSFATHVHPDRARYSLDVAPAGAYVSPVYDDSVVEYNLSGSALGLGSLLRASCPAEPEEVDACLPGCGMSRAVDVVLSSVRISLVAKVEP